MEEFLKDEQCERCKGPLCKDAHQRISFIEETFSYVRQSVWICYACGHENTLDSEPHYT